MKTLLSIALVLAAAASHAQTITVSGANSSFSAFFAGGTDGTYQSSVSHAYTVSDALYSFNLRGDLTAQMSGTADQFDFQAFAYFTLTTGAAPVQLTAITVSYNGKEVVSGGSTAEYTASNYYRAELFAPGFGSDFAHAAFLPDRSTQGIFIEALSTDLPTTILAANTPYRLHMGLYPILLVAEYPSSSSMLGYSVEFGGPIAQSFEGVTVSFLANPVPEPAGWLMLGVGLAGLLARRRLGR